jgi:hypothetical protein
MTTRGARASAVLLAAACCACFVPGKATAQPGGRSKEYRSLNTEAHLIAIQKDGRLDVALGDGTPVVSDAFPMIWFEGRDGPERLKTSGAWTERNLVEDQLGQGQGIHHQFKGCEWSLRAYPTRPFFAVQAGYTNEGKKPVQVRALFPWCVGEPGRGFLTLGSGTADAAILTGATSGVPRVLRGEAQSDDAVAVFDAMTGKSLIAGFITQDHARNVIEIAQPAPETKNQPSAFNRFRAGCYFDPPLTLAPGETLYSEVLYLSFAEPDPVAGLQRYARAAQVANHRSGPSFDAPLHAWILKVEATTNLADVAATLKRAGEHVPPRLIGHVLVGQPGVPATAQAPNATASLAETIRAAGYEPVLWFDPFALAADSPLAKTGRESGSARRLDLHRPEALQYLRATGEGLRALGFTAIAGVTVEAPSAGAGVDLIRAAILAFRAGLGDKGRIYGVSSSLLSGILLEGVITSAADHRYLTPQPARQSVWFGERTGTGEGLRAEVTSAALSGCGLLVPLPPEPELAAIGTLLQFALPAPAGAARPVDLFTAQPPRVLTLKATSIDGEAHVAAITNWSREKSDSTALSLAQLGLSPGTFYTVYDFWRQQYLGTAADRLDVAVPPEGVRVLVFRPLLSHPMLVSTGANLGQNSPALQRVTWDPQARRLHVELGEPAETEAARRFTLSVPPPYRMTGVVSKGAEKIPWEAKETSATISLPSEASARHGFDAIFEVRP